MKKRILIISCMIFILAGTVNAQKFRNSAGFKIGSINGPVYQKFYGENQAYEIIFGFHKDGMQAYVLNEWYSKVSIGIQEEFYFYYGLGGHAGYSKYSRDKYYYDVSGAIYYENQKTPYYSVGVDGIGGLEYRIYQVPMTIGIEIQPMLDFYGLRYVHFDTFNIQVSFKFIL